MIILPRDTRIYLEKFTTSRCKQNASRFILFIDGNETSEETFEIKCILSIVPCSFFASLYLLRSHFVLLSAANNTKWQS